VAIFDPATMSLARSTSFEACWLLTLHEVTMTQRRPLERVRYWAPTRVAGDIVSAVARTAFGAYEGALGTGTPPTLAAVYARWYIRRHNLRRITRIRFRQRR
jgi:hypothetical protein